MVLLRVLLLSIQIFAISFSGILVVALEDGHEMCAQWAAAGECEANPNYMLSNCQKSCAEGIYILCHLDF